MIKFFRKIRQDLLSKGKTGKYLKYAIGEILLVVIGILIALQINNWNESRKQRQKEIVNLIALKKDLENDLNTEFIPGITMYNEKNKALSILKGFYINKETTPKDSLLNYFNMSLIEWNFVLNTGAFDNLKSTGIDVISSDSLRTKISSLYSNDYPEIELKNSKIQQFFDNEFSPILSDNVVLYNSTLLQNDFDYLKNSKQISNRIVKLLRLRIWLMTTVNEIKLKVEGLIGDINKELQQLDK